MRLSKKSYEQNIICGQTQLNDIAHEQTIIRRQLFTGNVVGSRPMKRKRNCIEWSLFLFVEDICPNKSPSYSDKPENRHILSWPLISSIIVEIFSFKMIIFRIWSFLFILSDRMLDCVSQDPERTQTSQDHIMRVECNIHWRGQACVAGLFDACYAG